MNLCHKFILTLSITISLNVNADTLSEIAMFSEKICFNVLEGQLTRTNIDLTLKGDATGLAKAIGLSIGADGTLKQGEEAYKGIPIDKLPPVIPTPAQCKLELAKVLIEERRKINETNGETKKKSLN